MSLIDLKDQIKEVPISRIISGYVSLTKRGNIQMGLCPFHDDTRPSLRVDDSKNMFMCFACQTGGDSITFVEKLKGVPFVDALKEIAKNIGLSFENYFTPKKSSPRLEYAQKILSKTKQLYFKIATENHPHLFEDFAKSRGLSPEIIRNFAIGFAPDNNCVAKYLYSISREDERNKAISIAEDIHLIGKDKNNPDSHYDTFRGRIMFPIHDNYGNICGFGGRAAFDYQKAKYLNSKESFCFNKKNILYGFHLAKSSIRNKDSVILVEGYMDLITMHQFGFENSVAVMGVALGKGALNNLKSLTSNFYLALDNDQAGFKAMSRINEMCLSNDIIPKIIDFSPFKDPDDYLKNEGPIEFQKLCDNAHPFIDILIEKSIPKEIPEIADFKLNILKDTFEIVAPLKDNLAATERLVQVGQRLGLKSDSSQIVNFYQEYLKKVNEKSSWPKNQQTTDSKQKLTENNLIEYENQEQSNSDALPVKRTRLTHAEKLFIQEIIKHPELLAHSAFDTMMELLDNEHIKSYVQKLKELVCDVIETDYQNFMLETIRDTEYPLELKEVVGVTLFNYQRTILEERIVHKLLEDIKIRLHEDKLKSKREQLRIKQNSCTIQTEKNILIQELIEIEKDINKLKSHKYPREKA